MGPKTEGKQLRRHSGDGFGVLDFIPRTCSSNEIVALPKTDFDETGLNSGLMLGNSISLMPLQRASSISRPSNMRSTSGFASNTLQSRSYTPRLKRPTQSVNEASEEHAISLRSTMSALPLSTLSTSILECSEIPQSSFNSHVIAYKSPIPSTARPREKNSTWTTVIQRAFDKISRILRYLYLSSVLRVGQLSVVIASKVWKRSISIVPPRI